MLPIDVLDHSFDAASMWFAEAYKTFLYILLPPLRFGFSRTFNHNGPSPSRLLTCQHGKVMHPKTVSRKCAHQTPILESREQTQRGGHKINNLTTYQIVSDAAVQDIAVAGFRRDGDIPQRPVPKRKPAKQARGKGEEVRTSAWRGGTGRTKDSGEVRGQGSTSFPT